MQIRNRIMDKLREQGKSVNAFSLQVGISYPNIRAMTKDFRDMRVSTAIRIAKALGCTLDDLFWDEEEKELGER